MSLYNDTVNEHSHQDGLKDAKCDNCGKPATRWFGSTSVRICNDVKCRERYQEEWNEAFRQAQLESQREEENY